MLRPVMRMMNVIVEFRYGLLAAALLSTLALPQWSAASNTRTTSDGRIILAQTPPADDKDKKDQPKGKQLPKVLPKQQNIQPQPNANVQPKGAPAVNVQPKAAPTVNIQPKGAPTVNVQPKGAPTVNIQPKGAPTVNVQPKGAPTVNVQPKGAPTVNIQPKGAPTVNVQPKGAPTVNVQPKGAPTVNVYSKGAPTVNVQPKGAPTVNVQPKGPQFAPKNAQQPKGTLQTFGNVEQLRSLRRQRTEGGRVIIEEPGNRFIVRENGRVIVRHNDAERFRRFGVAREERRGREIYSIVRRPDGTEIITVTDASGRLLRRIRRGRDRREVILIDNRPRAGATGFFLGLAAPRITIPRERYIVDMEGAPPALLYETLEAEPLMPIERAYSLDEVRYNVELRDRMRRIDIDTIHFESGSWEVAPDQYPALQGIAEAIQRVVSDNPSAVFMIEGYTDAVGEDVDNLSLSDRRAESVAEILTGNFNVPPENLVAQGYGEQYLKIPTDGPSRENRRVAVRNVTRLLQGAGR